MNLKLDVTFLKRLVPGTGSVVTQITSLLASRLARWVLIGLALLAIGYLGQQKVWQPLQNKNILPVGTGATAADITVLQDINAQRAARAQHIPHDFSPEAQLIVPHTSTAP